MNRFYHIMTALFSKLLKGSTFYVIEHTNGSRNVIKLDRTNKIRVYINVSNFTENLCNFDDDNGLRGVQYSWNTSNESIIVTLSTYNYCGGTIRYIFSSQKVCGQRVLTCRKYVDTVLLESSTLILPLTDLDKFHEKYPDCCEAFVEGYNENINILEKLDFVFVKQSVAQQTLVNEILYNCAHKKILLQLSASHNLKLIKI